MAVGSISINGLLGGTAGKIDTEALVNALMAAKSMPKQQLQIQVGQQQKVTQAYQSINSAMASITTAANALRDDANWSATKASSSSANVVASSVSSASAGSTTFTINSLAQAQVSTVRAATGAPTGQEWVGDYTQGLDFKTGVDEDGNDIIQHVALESGSVEDIAKAINASKDLGIRAAVVNADGGQVLQLTSAKTGTANAFDMGTATFAQALTPMSAASDAQVSVGGQSGAGYTISSSSNTFVDAMPGVTFTLGPQAKTDDDFTVTVGSDTSKVAATVKKLTDAVNSARLAIDNYTDKGGVLQGDSNVTTLTQDMSFVFTSATAGGKSLTEYGIDISKDGLLSFDDEVFSAAYNADPTGTMQALSDAVGTPLKEISEASSAPVTGSLSQLITSGNDRVADINKRIDAMQDRLNQTEDQLRTKYVAMQSSLAKLQAQGDWLTNMFKSMQPSKDD